MLIYFYCTWDLDYSVQQLSLFVSLNLSFLIQFIIILIPLFINQIPQMLAPFQLKTHLNCALIFIICMVSVQSIYQKAPPYFNSFYCNLGTKTMAQSGTYSCTSPKVIERADKFALALVEFNKKPSENIWFKAQVTQTARTSLTSVQIKLEFKTAYTTRYGYMVVAIGRQPENTWIDLINVKLPQNPADSQVSMTPHPTNSFWKYLDQVFEFPSWETFLSTYTHFLIFTTSFGIQTNPPSNPASFSLHRQTGSATSLRIIIQTYLWNKIRTIFWGVLVFNEPAMPSSTAYKLSNQYQKSGTGTFTVNLHANDFKQYGPPFNTKCLIGYQFIIWGSYGSNDRTITLLNSTNNNYYQTQTQSASSKYISLKFQFLCFADTSRHVRGDFEFFDPLTGVFYTDASQCPLPPPASSPHQCQKCSQLQCTNCSSTNRTQCFQCTTGYGVTSSGSCASCSSPFSNCTLNDNTMFFECQIGYFLNLTNLNCFPCQFPCIECQETSINCTKCPQKLYYLNGTTFGNCKFCNQSLSFCLKCNSAGNKCEECNSTKHYLESDICNACTPPCLECTSSTDCLSCADTTTLLVNETTPGTSNCKNCSDFMQNCDTCLKKNVCLSCKTLGGFFFLTFPSSACWSCEEARPNCTTCAESSTSPRQELICTKCQNGYHLLNESCYKCPYGCKICTDANTCISCITTGTYVIQGTLCVQCREVQALSNCVQCLSASQCTKCQKGFILRSGSCIKCQNLTFPNEITQRCDLCISPCKTCFTAEDCLTCVEFFYEHVPATNKCKDHCGDTFVITDECDNGLGVFHDGCSDQCKQEKNYTCRNESVTHQSGQSVKKSTCSYDLKVNISLFSAKKESFKNTMTFIYEIGPYLFGLPGTTTRPFTQDELKQIFVLSQKTTTSRRVLLPLSTPVISVESVKVDPANSKVSMTFSYHRKIRESDIELQLDFQYLRSYLALPYFNTTLDSEYIVQILAFQPLSMLGEFYTEEQYSQAVLLNQISNIIGIMSFSAFLIGIFTKEVAGLEMAMLCQFTFLSLFYFRKSLSLSFFALRGLSYSTGYNLPMADMNYRVLDQNPPQSFTLGFDPRNFWKNFNLMTVLYILPLVAVIPFIPLKGKCIRKISMIELGNKWVDLLIGEIMLFCVLFNFQYLSFCLIAYYRDGRDIKDYGSSTAISLGFICTLFSFLGFLLKPEIYGNFRTAFRYDTELRKEIIEEREKTKQCEQHLTKKFKEESMCEALKTLLLKFHLFVNENYFWRNYRKAHTLLTYNHYNFLILYFLLITLGLNLMRESEIALMAVSLILLIDLILMRPYCEVSEKLRGILFAIIYIGVSLVRYLDEKILDEKQKTLSSFIIFSMLGLALIWTYLSLGSYLYSFFMQKYHSKDQLVRNLFKEVDILGETQGVMQQDEVMRNLIRRYERVELQYNVDNARTDLISNQSKSKFQEALQVKDQTNYHPLEEITDHFMIFSKEDPDIQQILNKADQKKFYKNLRDELRNQNKRKQKNLMKGTVTGDQMLKFLQLNNFSKYGKAFLFESTHQNDRSQIQYQRQKYEKKLQTKNTSEEPSGKSQISKLMMIREQQEQGQEMEEKDEYISVEPKNLQQANYKIEQERVMIDENEYLRYKRAMRLLSRDGLIVDKKLVTKGYEFI